MAYEKNSNKFGMTDDAAEDKYVVMEALASQVGASVRLAQRKLRGYQCDQLKALFSVADVLVSSIGRCLNDSLIDDGDACVPLLVPAHIFERVVAAKLSIQIQARDCLDLGFNVHSAQRANVLNRDAKGEHAFHQHRQAHLNRNAAVHEFGDLVTPARCTASTIFLDNLITSRSKCEPALQVSGGSDSTHSPTMQSSAAMPVATGSQAEGKHISSGCQPWKHKNAKPSARKAMESKNSNAKRCLGIVRRDPWAGKKLTIPAATDSGSSDAWVHWKRSVAEQPNESKNSSDAECCPGTPPHDSQPVEQEAIVDERVESTPAMEDSCRRDAEEDVLKALAQRVDDADYGAAHVESARVEQESFVAVEASPNNEATTAFEQLVAELGEGIDARAAARHDELFKKLRN